MKFARRATLILGAILGSLFLIAGIAAVTFDARALIFRSGSMAPAIETGALAFAQEVDASELAVGDIVSVKSSEGERITHRIVKISPAGKSASITLKGDANSVVDQQPYVVTSADRVLFDIPKLGYVVAWFSSPFGLILLGMYAAFLLSVMFRPRDRDTGGGGKRRLAAGASAVALIAATGVAGNGALAEPTLAAWTDQATAVSGDFQAHYVQRPNSMSCANGTAVLLGYYNGATLSWSHKDTKYDYVVRLYTDSGTLISGSEHVVTGAGAVGSTLSTTYSANDVAGLLQLGSPVHARLFSRLKAASSWESSLHRSWRIDTGLLGILLLNGIKCGADTTPPEATGPTIAFTSPTNATSGDATAFQNAVRNACGSNRPGCGTVTDPSGVKSVTYQLKRVRSNGTEYFHASSAVGGIWNSSNAFESMELSSGVWKIDGLITTAYYDWNEAMTFTLTVKAVDNYDNETTSSISFTLN